MKITGYEILAPVDEKKGMGIIWTGSEIIFECPYYCWTIPVEAVISFDLLSADDWRRRDKADCPDAPEIDSALIDGFGMLEIAFYISKTDLTYRFAAPESALRPENCPTDADALFGYKTAETEKLKIMHSEVCEAMKKAKIN